MKIELKTNGVGQVYFPKFLRKAWGEEYDIIPNDKGGCIYPKGTDPKKVKASLEVIIKDLENRITENEASK